jgi:hypothetical protein
MGSAYPVRSETLSPHELRGFQPGREPPPRLRLSPSPTRRVVIIAETDDRSGPGSPCRSVAHAALVRVAPLAGTTGVAAPPTRSWGVCKCERLSQGRGSPTFGAPDCGRSNPPNATLGRLPRRGIIVWASIQTPDPTGWPPRGRKLTLTYALAHASRFPCCEAASIGGLWELYGDGPNRAYSVILRVFWGSTPSESMGVDAQRAIRALNLPRAR